MKINSIELKIRNCEPKFPWMRGHVQTIMGHLIPSKTRVHPYQSTIVSTQDGGLIGVKFLNRGGEFTVAVFHGLAGNSESDYMRRTADVASEFGWNVVLVDHRGANPTISNQKTYHSGRGDDASEVVKWIKREIPSKVITVGYSMSGSILLNLLCGRKGTVKPDIAVIVNAPLDLKDAAVKLTQGLSRVYDWRFFLLLKNLIKQNGHDIDLPYLGRTIDIDEVYTSRMNGFSGADDYYTNCSTFEFVDNISTPSFVLSSYDDPFVDVSYYQRAKWNDCVNLNLQKFGGHMGYIEKIDSLRSVNRWLDDYLRAVFNEISIGLKII